MKVIIMRTFWGTWKIKAVKFAFFWVDAGTVKTSKKRCWLWDSNISKSISKFKMAAAWWIEQRSRILSNLSELNILVRPEKICLLKVNNWNTQKKCKILSKLTVKAPQRRHWHHWPGVFIVNFEHIWNIFLVLSFFFYLGFLSQTFTYHKTAGEREAILYNS